MKKINNSTKFSNKTAMAYSPDEEKYIKKLYTVKHMKLRDVVDATNRKFWKEKEIRTERGVEKKIRVMGWCRQPHSDYMSGQMTPKNKEIWRLHKAGKSHAQISKLIGVPMGTVKSTISYIKNKTLTNELESKKVKYRNDKDLKDYETKEELRRRIESLQKELTKKSAINAVIVDTVKSTVKALPIVKAPKFIIKKKHGPETAMLELGDLHIGEKVLKEDVANVTEYNFDIFNQRLDDLMQGIAECVDIQRSKIPINTLDINFVGDVVTGEDIYIGQNRNLDMMLTKQTFEGANLLANKLLLPCAKLFNKVRVRCVWGNHGRGWGKKGQVHQKTNFDYIVYTFLNEILKNQNNIEFYIAECPLMLYRLPEAPRWTHLVSHGNEVGGWMGLPYYGLERDHGKYMQLFGTNINYWHLGHHHRSAKIDIPYGERIVNGSFVGGSELSVLKMKTASQPKQVFFGFNNKRGITWKYDIQLATMKKIEIDNNGVFTPYNTDAMAIKLVGGKKK